MAVLEEAKKASEKAEESLLVALCKTRFMHTATATKILLSLQKRMLDANRKTDSALLSAIAKRRNFDIEAVTGTRNSATAKRVSFVIDYSGILIISHSHCHACIGFIISGVLFTSFHVWSEDTVCHR